MRFKMMTVAVCVVLAAPAVAQTADSTLATKPKKEKKICRRDGALAFRTEGCDCRRGIGSKAYMRASLPEGPCGNVWFVDGGTQIGAASV